MPPPRGTPNILEGPGDYDVTSTIHNDTYPAIDPLKADLSGKAVFITGGSKGLGRAMVLSFAKAGASYIAAGARSDMTELAKDVAAAAATAKRSPPKFLPIQLDVTDPQSVENAAVAVKSEFGRCDVVVNNAGVLGRFGGILQTDPQEWWQVLGVNFRGPYLVSRAFLPLLLESELKALVHVTSVAAHLLNPTLSAYQTSKMALLKFSQLVHAEFGSKGLVTFAVHPGNCPTDIMGGPDGLSEHEKLIFVETPEISADTIVYLTSEKRDWLGGRYINVTWDMPELIAMKDEIVQGDKLKVKFIY
uniref:C-11-ketoreductase n=1 Tax=Monascus ruber TaxID=89489 RepID=A0A5Q0TJT6_MONRU|nr:C-11-ketoreductase [Monascus ruber]